MHIIFGKKKFVLISNKICSKKQHNNHNPGNVFEMLGDKIFSDGEIIQECLSVVANISLSKKTI